MPIVTHYVEFPEGFDDWAWEARAKGWLQGVTATIDQRRYSVTFYDPARLAQDIRDVLKDEAAFFERNLIVVAEITRQRMEAAIELVAKTGRYRDMVPE